MRRLALLLSLAVLAVPAGADSASRTLVCTGRFLNIPIKNGVPKVRLSFAVDGRPITASNVELAEGQPDWWAYLDLGAWRGQRLTVSADRPAGLEGLEVSDRIRNRDSLYREALRPQFHFSPRRGWTNDPNGMVYYRAEYHLFFQHNPYGWGSDNKHWGHAVSRDLAHWQEVEEALSPDELGTIYSGSAVVDWNNTSGFGTRDRPAQVLFYTAAGIHFGQCLAYSLDGRTYTKYSGNPVVAEIGPANRDPKVLWYAPGREWIMGVFVGPRRAPQDADGRWVATPAHTIQFLSSTDLRHWKMLGSTPGFFECPNLFELAVDGDSSRRKWILSDASSGYMVGRFDGTRFVPETPKIAGQCGPRLAMYAPQVFSDLPRSDGRCIQVGWLMAPSPGMPFNQCLTMPMELRLRSTPGGPRLSWTPVREMESLRTGARHAGPVRLQSASANPLADFRSELVEIRADFTADRSARAVFRIRGVPVIYDAARGEIRIRDYAVPVPAAPRQTLAIYLDRTVMEVFAGGGLVYLPYPVIPDAADRSLSVSAEQGAVDFTRLDAYSLGPIWQ